MDTDQFSYLWFASRVWLCSHTQCQCTVLKCRRIVFLMVILFLLFWNSSLGQPAGLQSCQRLTYFHAKTTWHSHAPECGAALVLVFWIMTSFQVCSNSIVLLCVWGAVFLHGASTFSLKLSTVFIISTVFPHYSAVLNEAHAWHWCSSDKTPCVWWLSRINVAGSRLNQIVECTYLLKILKHWDDLQCGGRDVSLRLCRFRTILLKQIQITALKTAFLHYSWLRTATVWSVPPAWGRKKWKIINTKGFGLPDIALFTPYVLYWQLSCILHCWQ